MPKICQNLKNMSDSLSNMNPRDASASKKHGLDRYESFRFGWLVFNMWTGFNLPSAGAVTSNDRQCSRPRNPVKALAETRKSFVICHFGLECKFK